MYLTNPFSIPRKTFLKLQEQVVFTQGDTLRMTSDYLEYDGANGKAKAWGNVFLKQPDMSLETDTLYIDRNENIAYYDSLQELLLTAVVRIEE